MLDVFPVAFVSDHNLKMNYFKEEEVKAHTSPLGISWKKLNWSSGLSDSIYKDGYQHFLPAFSLHSFTKWRLIPFPLNLGLRWVIEYSISDMLGLCSPGLRGHVECAFTLRDGHYVKGWSETGAGGWVDTPPQARGPHQHGKKHKTAIPLSPTQTDKQWTNNGHCGSK